MLRRALEREDEVDGIVAITRTHSRDQAGAPDYFEGDQDARAWLDMF